jgi:hypothetical protein
MLDSVLGDMSVVIVREIPSLAKAPRIASRGSEGKEKRCELHLQSLQPKAGMALPPISPASLHSSLSDVIVKTA